MQILLVDDSGTMRAIQKKYLVTLGIKEKDILEAEDGKAALAIFESQLFDLVLTDWNMPVMDGLEFLTEIRKRDQEIPVIMITTEAERSRVLAAITAGVSDYLTKPFSPRELVARINSLLRRNQAVVSEDILEAGELSLDPASHRVSIANTPVEIGPTEYRLLAFFLSHQERVYSRDQILDHVWGGNVYMDERTVDVHIRRLRKAISLEGHDRFVQTVRGAGYRFSTKGVELNTA